MCVVLELSAIFKIYFWFTKAKQKFWSVYKFSSISFLKKPFYGIKQTTFKVIEFLSFFLIFLLVEKSQLIKFV